VLSKPAAHRPLPRATETENSLPPINQPPVTMTDEELDRVCVRCGAPHRTHQFDGMHPRREGDTIVCPAYVDPGGQ
jgi:hypothetical protein